MTADAVADRMTALLGARARTFYELVRELPDVEYRTLLRAWGALRERRVLGRDEEGRYRLATSASVSRRRNDMFKIKAMDHIVLNVPDINRSLAFYMDVLGLEPERLDEFRRGEVRFPSVRISADTVIDLFPMKPGEALGGGPGLQNLNHFTMVVEAADFEGFQKHLAEQSVKIEDGPGRRWGARGYGQSVYFRDPDGNRIEVRCYPSGA